MNLMERDKKKMQYNSIEYNNTKKKNSNQSLIC